ADGVGQLHLALGGEARGDDILGDVAGYVGGLAVDLGRVLAAEGTAPMPAASAVGVDDDLASRQATVAVRTALEEAAGRVDVATDHVLVGAVGAHAAAHHLDASLDQVGALGV